jgi:hypothetical protein
MVKGLSAKRQRVNIRLPELYIGNSGMAGPSLRFRNRICGQVNRRESSLGAPLSERDRLCSDTAPCFKHYAAGRISSVAVQ